MHAYLAFVGTQLAIWSFIIAICVNGCRGCKKAYNEREALQAQQTMSQPVSTPPAPEAPKAAPKHRKNKK